MALPTLSTRVPSRFRYPGAYMDWQRERKAEKQHQLETHARYLERQSVCTDRHDVWTSTQYFNKSMSEYNKQRRKEHLRTTLELRRNRLRTLFQEEMNQLQAEQRDLVQDRKTGRGRQWQKRERRSTARQEMREKLEADMLKDFIVTQWKKKQLPEDIQQQASEEEEERHFGVSNAYERARKEAPETMRQAEEKNKQDENKRMEDRCQRMVELKLREDESLQLKEEQKALFVKQRQLEKLEKERKQLEEKQENSEMQRFLVRHYRTQMRRRAEQVQEELEAVRKMLEALMEGEEEEEEEKEGGEEERMKSSLRKRAIADVAWMKHVIEEQLQLEREREAEIDDLHWQEAQRVWDEQEPQWKKERKARELLMQDVLSERQHQLTMKIQKNYEAQEESRRRRKELIQKLEEEGSWMPEDREARRLSLTIGQQKDQEDQNKSNTE